MSNRTFKTCSAFIFAVSLLGFQNCSGGFQSGLKLTSASNGANATSANSGGGTSNSPTGNPNNAAMGTNANQAPGCTNLAVMQNAMAIQSPCALQLVVNNQITPLDGFDSALRPIGLSDQNATLNPAPMPIQVTAPGLVNIEVWTHNSMQTRLVQVGTTGVFTGSLDLSKEPAGPLHVMFLAYNVGAGQAASLKLAGEITVFVKGQRIPIPTPAGAHGLSLRWSDNFTTLNSAGCVSGTGNTPTNCTQATAASGASWWENLAQGGNYGDASFEYSAFAHNPYTILPTGGMLRMRATFDPNYNDPYGWGRHWYSANLSTAFGSSYPNTTNIPQMSDGYYEARMMIPNASCGVPWHQVGGGSPIPDCSGGTWPAFWMRNLNVTDNSGSIELDVTETYSEDAKWTGARSHAWGVNGVAASIPGTSDTGQDIYVGDTPTDLTWDFHRYGLLIQGSGTNHGTVCSYLDDVNMGCATMPVLANGQTPTWIFILTLAMGSGWPDNAPPSNQYDMFVDYVAAWTK